MNNQGFDPQEQEPHFTADLGNGQSGHFDSPDDLPPSTSNPNEKSRDYSSLLATAAGLGGATVAWFTGSYIKDGYNDELLQLQDETTRVEGEAAKGADHVSAEINGVEVSGAPDSVLIGLSHSTAHAETAYNVASSLTYWATGALAVFTAYSLNRSMGGWRGLKATASSLFPRKKQ